jgi:putative N-acetylmannosamine-6-phosphate epimerase
MKFMVKVKLVVEADSSADATNMVLAAMAGLCARPGAAGVRITVIRDVKAKPCKPEMAGN